MEQFSRDKLLFSVYASLGHRSDAPEATSHLVSTAIARLMKNHSSGVLRPQGIAHAVHDVLLHFDDAAATYYAAYHVKKPS